MDSVKFKPVSRGALQVILHISLLSFLLSLYYSCTPCFLHSLNLILKQFINKKPAFLFFIIILVFLAARDCSMLSSSTAANHLYREFTAPQNFQIVFAVKEAKQEDQEEEEEEESINENDNEQDDEDEGRFLYPNPNPNPEEEEEEEGMEVMDELDQLHIDELNRRFEDFITKEKRRRSLEALQLVIL